MTESDQVVTTIAACPIPCDPDCDAVCHADHDPVHKKEHWPWDCPAADRYDWGHPFVREAITRLRKERDLARTVLGFATSLGDRRKRQRDEVTARAEQAEAEVRRLRALIADEHSRLSQDFDNAEEVARLRAQVAELHRRLGEDESGRDLSGWSAEENAEFEQLYGVQAAMRLRAANDRIWAVVQELRNEAIEAGRDPYQDPIAQRLSAALVGGASVPQDAPSPAERPVNSRGLIDTLLRVSGLNATELGRLIGVSGNAVRLWSVGGAINQAHYERAMDLNGRMQRLPSKTFYGRREALFDVSGGRSVYDQMLSELSSPALDSAGEPAYFNVKDD